MMTTVLLKPAYAGLQVGGVHVGVPSSPPTYSAFVRSITSAPNAM